MQEIKNSELLNLIIERAECLCKANKCSGLNRDYLLVASIMVFDTYSSRDYKSAREYENVMSLLSRYTRDAVKTKSILDQWQGKQIPLRESIILSTQRGKAISSVKQAKKAELTADAFLDEMLKEETPGMRALHVSGDDSQPKVGIAVKAPVSSDGASNLATRSSDYDAHIPKQGISSIIKKVKALYTSLQQSVLGQQHAISTFIAGYFQSELKAQIEKDRRQPRAIFLFAGPSGVGKTYLSEEAARNLGLPYRRFDMSEYANPNATDELSGSDANYKASSEGQLTGFVSQHPNCVLLFDEIEKASLDVIHLFLQIMDAGRLRDNKTDKEVSFLNAILIFTTNVGKALYEENDSVNLSGISRDVIIDAITRDINPKTNTPYFPAAICSRFASGNVVMFNHLDALSLRTIVERELVKNADNIKEAMGLSVTFDRNVPTALLLAEGASADARMVKSRANSFFAEELFELFRLMPAGISSEGADQTKEIRFTVNVDEEHESIRGLFNPLDQIHAIAYSDKHLDLDEENPNVPMIHYVHNTDEAKEIFDQYNIQMVLCSAVTDESDSRRKYLNAEDQPSEARDFLKTTLDVFPTLPVILMEPVGHEFSEEEKFSYYRRGIRGFLSLEPERLCERLIHYTEGIFQQNVLTQLARGNQLISFETAQRSNFIDNSADIVLFDIRLEKAIKAEDSDNIMSLLSTPDVKFDDVIGAEDAKRELSFFVSYMHEPKRFLREGVSAPKGVLLYGPPGTGKTLLAKAFAAESHATYIATEGNQFYKGIVGQGAAMVHRLFSIARRYAPSVIFIDEIDTIARARSGRNTDMAQDSEQILTALFAEMDGFATNKDKPVFLLGATNYSIEPGAKMRLDPAMLRRFDRHILIDLPSVENRKLFLKKETDKRKLFQISKNAISDLAERSTGMSLAQLSSILDLAARTSLQKQVDTVGDHALDVAFETFNSGEARKWSPDITLRTARHEAGHTLLSWLSGEKPSYVTIVSRGTYGGYMQYADQEDRMGFTKRELMNRILASLGGRAAEIVYYGEEDGLSTGASGDLKFATEMAKQMLCSYGMDEHFGLASVCAENGAISSEVQEAINRILRDELTKAVELIEMNKNKIDSLVEKLLSSNSLNAQNIDDIFNGVG